MRKFEVAIAIVLLGAITACGAQSEAEGTAAPVDNPAAVDGQADASMDSAAPAATSDDVVAALRCHDAVSTAMASNIVRGDGSAVGLREQVRWFSEAQRRAKVAGIDDSQFTRLQESTTVPMSTEEQRASARPLLDECLANVPVL